MGSDVRRRSLTIRRALTVATVATAAFFVFGAAQAFGALSPFASESGKVSLSVDAFGSNGSTGTLQVEKHAGATVRKAYLFAASTGFSGYVPQNGDVLLNGSSVIWNAAETISNSIASNNAESDVTALVKPLIDGAPAGVVNVPITENKSNLYDGDVLAVIFDDPTVTSSGSVILMYGAQSTSGDDFSVALSDPVDKTNPSFGLDLSLGISFGFQPAGQFSTVDVNGHRMTSSAGGQDDGESANGALITAGGIGDLNDDPPNPNATDQGCVGAMGPAPRCDDELYSLIPFVSNGDTTLSFHTQNPSNDDNIFFAALNVASSAAIVGAGIVLGPADATNPINTDHTLTATVQDADGDPVSGKTVTFTATSGPNAGLSGSDVTDADGHATFTYSSSATGTDTWIATFHDATGATQTSNPATKTWTNDGDTTPPMCLLSGMADGPPKQIQITVEDSDSGLGSVVVTESANADTVVPPFTTGSTGAVVIISTKIDQSKSSQVALTVTDVAGNTIKCDPIVPALLRRSPITGMISRTFNNVLSSERFVTIANAVRGSRTFTVAVNGKPYTVRVAAGQTRRIDVAAALRRGSHNTIVVNANRAKATRATVTVSS